MDPTKALLFAYILWSNHHADKDSDSAVRPFLCLPSHLKNWLFRARTAQFISSNEDAKRMGISTQAYCKLERNEALGTISLQSLARAAKALECELVYAVRPKTKVIYSEVIWRKILPLATIMAEKRRPLFHMKGNAIATAAKELTTSPKFRHEQNWSKRT
jgi:transcriptional regulator with XRE-family HTH domain